MRDYFLLIDAPLFEERLRPALADSWRKRSFVPCQEVCRSLLDRVTELQARYSVYEGESLVHQVSRGLTFDRAFWSGLVWELLFYSASEIPEIHTCLDTLRCLVLPEQRQFLEQAHLGRYRLTFGAVVYRPDSCGLNDRAEVRRLADFLDSFDPLSWQENSLAALPGMVEEERGEELALAREWFGSLRGMYQRARQAGQVIVREIL